MKTSKDFFTDKDLHGLYQKMVAMRWHWWLGEKIGYAVPAPADVRRQIDDLIKSIDGRPDHMTTCGGVVVINDEKGEASRVWFEVIGAATVEYES